MVVLGLNQYAKSEWAIWLVPSKVLEHWILWHFITCLTRGLPSSLSDVYWNLPFFNLNNWRKPMSLVLYSTYDSICVFFFFVPHGSWVVTKLKAKNLIVFGLEYTVTECITFKKHNHLLLTCPKEFSHFNSLCLYSFWMQRLTILSSLSWILNI